MMNKMNFAVLLGVVLALAGSVGEKTLNTIAKWSA